MAPPQERRDNHIGDPQNHPQPVPCETASAPRCANWISYAVAVSQQTSSGPANFPSTTF